ncbi:rhombosortase [Photobacterium nomapromontoriensis]|uniref:rhombosortase n=1 Tax=Photobacterium nomapromontoriensis TaxID=2910237 RepID=UPI003D12A17B
MSIRLIVIFTIAMMAVAQLPSAQSILAWQQSTIAQGEVWQIVTGNFTHTNWPHMIMNSIALAIITFIFRAQLNAYRLLGLLFGLSAIIGITLLWSSMNWYAGLSGVLHGLFAWGACRDILAKEKLGWLMLAGVIIKVAEEQVFGGSLSSAALIDARVAIEAHLTGVIAGIVIAIVPWLITLCFQPSKQ